MNILFLTPYPIEGPSSRFRVWQYLPYFEKAGHRCRVSSFLDVQSYGKFYKKGHWFTKSKILIRGLARRLMLLPYVPYYQVVVVQREVFPFGPPLFERVIKLLNRNIVFDFDDAVYHPQTSEGNKAFLFLKSVNKPRRVIKFSSLVIAGNRILAKYAKIVNSRVEIIPTPIDVAYYHPRQGHNSRRQVVIGWIGSRTSAPFLFEVEEALRIVKSRFAEKVKIVVIGGDTFRFQNLEAEYREWRLDEELQALQTFDIGLMPLPDNEWTRGKCGFKALEYMSMGIPAICSAVGVNRDIITHGVNGYLIESEGEWAPILTNLIQNSGLRNKIGRAAKQYVQKHYSLNQWADRYLQLLATF
jgi:glycosyltransferase involved in cell wall biosynthesis